MVNPPSLLNRTATVVLGDAQLAAALDKMKAEMATKVAEKDAHLQQQLKKGKPG